MLECVDNAGAVSLREKNDTGNLLTPDVLQERGKQFVLSYIHAQGSHVLKVS